MVFNVPPKVHTSKLDAIRYTARFLLRRMSSGSRELPHFIIIGVMRGGTTSLYNYLIEHPCVAPSFIKEVHFFDERFSSGAPWYRANFVKCVEGERIKEVCGAFVTGESTPNYMFHPLGAKRVASTVPNVKLIVLLRDPVDRAYSHYQHQVRRKREDLGFKEALEKEEKRLEGEVERMLKDDDYVAYNHIWYSYRAKSIYMDQLEKWMELFPREQFLFLKSEDMYDDPRAIFTRVLEFLDLPEHDLKNFKKYNYGSYGKMPESLRKDLYDFFEPYNQTLYKLIGRDLGWGP